MDETIVLYSVIAFLIGLIVKSYLPSYLSKKGENLATKEDIEEITTKIESVKSAVEIQKDSHLDYMGDRKEALLLFYDEVTTFRYELMAVRFGDLPFDEGKSLYEFQSRFYSSVAGILKCYQRLVIFLPRESELLAYANNMTSSVIETRKVVEKNFGEVKVTCVDEERAFLAIDREGKDGYISAVKEADRANSKYWGSMKPHVESFIQHYQGYLTALNIDFQAQQIQSNKSS
ncbi:MAG: hypothetical protein AB1Y26_02955 [Cycloclasticus sp.]